MPRADRQPSITLTYTLTTSDPFSVRRLPNTSGKRADERSRNLWPVCHSQERYAFLLLLRPELGPRQLRLAYLEQQLQRVYLLRRH